MEVKKKVQNVTFQSCITARALLGIFVTAEFVIESLTVIMEMMKTPAHVRSIHSDII